MIALILGAVVAGSRILKDCCKQIEVVIDGEYSGLSGSYSYDYRVFTSSESECVLPQEAYFKDEVSVDPVLDKFFPGASPHSNKIIFISDGFISVFWTPHPSYTMELRDDIKRFFLSDSLNVDKARSDILNLYTDCPAKSDNSLMVAYNERKTIDSDISVNCTIEQDSTCCSQVKIESQAVKFLTGTYERSECEISDSGSVIVYDVYVHSQNASFFIFREKGTNVYTIFFYPFDNCSNIEDRDFRPLLYYEVIGSELSSVPSYGTGSNETLCIEDYNFGFIKVNDVNLGKGSFECVKPTNNAKDSNYILLYVLLPVFGVIFLGIGTFVWKRRRMRTS